MLNPQAPDGAVRHSNAARRSMDEADENERAARAGKGSPFLTSEQAAFYLGLSPRTLQDYRTAGTGPRFRRHGRRIRYHIDDLDNWSRGIAEAGGPDA
jgi:hypothetical protein